MAALMMYPENDPQGQLRATIIRGELEKAGWTIGGNLQLDFHWGTGDAAWVRSAAAQVLGTAPDVILANGDAAVKAAQQATKTIPVIFIASGDPVGDGLVASLAHPGGNLTGFAVMQPSLGAKLLGMLKQVAPRVGGKRQATASSCRRIPRPTRSADSSSSWPPGIGCRLSSPCVPPPWTAD
jgi:putative tryptophan/tyrosine transport system substrate-binding protein